MTTIETFHWKTEEAFSRIKQGLPVVLKECPIINPAYTNWTLDHIASLLSDDFPCDVYQSNSHRFPYWDTSHNSYKYQFTIPTSKATMSFREFLLTVRSQEEKPEDQRKYNYLHQSLVAEMGKPILEEYSKFSLQTAALYKMLANWGEMTSNLLLCGMKGYITPIHFDEQENLFTQLQGRKRVRIFRPKHWCGLYTYPNGHPQDRQSQVTLPSIPGSCELESEEGQYRFPAYKSIGKYELYADLEPGDVLYVPQYYFHQMEGLTDENISLSWWFKHTNRNKEIDYYSVELDETNLTAIRRNIESAISHMSGGGQRAHTVFLSIASGRTKLPGINFKEALSSSGSSGAILPPPDDEGKEVAKDNGDETQIAKREKAKPVPDYVTTELLMVDTDVSTVVLGLPSISSLILQAGALKLKDGDEEFCRIITEQALSMLTTLMPKEHTSGFLLQVASGRFNSF
jgi:hypoxia-inducible factor 1-alpha inhibitor (HIF hydroxylase)